MDTMCDGTANRNCDKAVCPAFAANGGHCYATDLYGTRGASVLLGLYGF